jgi:hypothetical protein
MKPRISNRRRLTLQREALRLLSPEALATIAGGTVLAAPQAPSSTCGPLLTNQPSQKVCRFTDNCEK